MSCLIIAEAGVNHNGSIQTAMQLIDAAVDAGADIVKFQTFDAAQLVSKSSPQADYQVQNLGQKSTQYEMLKKLELSFDDFAALAARCKAKKIGFMSTPFDERSEISP